MSVAVTRYHDFSCAHRAVGDPGHCSNIHGHNYRVHVTIEGEPNALGRVADFALIKTVFFAWIEQQWDHRLLLWIDDPLALEWKQAVRMPPAWAAVLAHSIALVSFNTSTENMAAFLIEQAQLMLDPTQSTMTVVEVRIEETRKCGAFARSTRLAHPPKKLQLVEVS